VLQNRAATLREFKKRFQKTAPSHAFAAQDCAGVADALQRLEVTGAYGRRPLRYFGKRLKELLEAGAADTCQRAETEDVGLLNAAATVAFAAVTILGARLLPNEFLMLANQRFAVDAELLSDEGLARAMCASLCETWLGVRVKRSALLASAYMRVELKKTGQISKA
jgi:hypothetical protein